MIISQYLTRFHYQGDLSCSLELLTNLQKAHLLHIPFENLDIHLGRPILLEKTYDKVVLRGRGGFCYELNGLFFALLQKIGFTVKMISARVYDPALRQAQIPEYGPEFDHMAIIATIGGADYLVDVGFGEFAFTPLRIEVGSVQKDQRGEFSMDSADGITFIVHKKVSEVFVPQYSFTKVPRVLNDFLAMCHYHQASPDSHFTQKRLCSLPTEHGRITLTGNVLKITEGDHVRETVLNSDAEIETALWDYFRIKL